MISNIFKPRTGAYLAAIARRIAAAQDRPSQAELKKLARIKKHH